MPCFLRLKLTSSGVIIWQKQYAKIAISVSFSKSLVKYYFHFLGVFLWWTLRFEQRFKMPWKALIYCVSDFCQHLVIVLSTNGNKLSNSIDTRVSGTFEIKVFVFVVINKVLNIMNIFVDSKIWTFTL